MTGHPAVTGWATATAPHPGSWMTATSCPAWSWRGWRRLSQLGARHAAVTENVTQNLMEGPSLGVWLEEWVWEVGRSWGALGPEV